MYLHEDDISVEEFDAIMLEMQQHDVMIACCELIYKHGLRNVLLRLADYCNDPKECYALYVLSDFYKENERAICKDAPTMQ